MKPIGGYFELALPQRPFLHDDSVLLNNGRACITSVLTERRIRRVWVPRYTCDVVVEPLSRLGLAWEFVPVGEDLRLVSPPSPAADELLIVNNYFGLQDDYCRALSESFGDRLLIDCSQAWYAPRLPSSHCFYTPRKFFGVPDGGCLYSPALIAVDAPEDQSHDRVSHLLKRLEAGAEAGFADFQRNDASLANQPVRRMSALTRALLGLVDHEAARQRRVENFELLDAALRAENGFAWPAEARNGPMVYPYRPVRGDAAAVRRRLIERKIFVATYWPNVFRWASPREPEYRLAHDTLPLPVDQRYGAEEMQRIIDTLT